jgi:hypothetical protein
MPVGLVGHGHLHDPFGAAEIVEPAERVTPPRPSRRSRPRSRPEGGSAPDGIKVEPAFC